MEIGGRKGQPPGDSAGRHGLSGLLKNRLLARLLKKVQMQGGA